MSEDNLYLLIYYLIYGLTLLILTYRSKNKLRTAIINFIVLALYSGLFFYNLTFNSSGGSGLLWLVYLMFAIGLHWLINLIGIALTYFETNEIKKTNGPTSHKESTLMIWQNYWKIFDELIELLKIDNQKKIISEFKDAQKYVNGLTDGWYDFKFAFEKSLKSNRQNMTEEQKHIANILLTNLNEYLSNR